VRLQPSDGNCFGITVTECNQASSNGDVLYQTISACVPLLPFSERPPPLPCRHAICDTCVTIFGSPSRSAEYVWISANVPRCQETCNLTVCQLPPTKGAVVVSVDGGGIRGLVTLGLLRALERRLDGTMTVAEMVDYIIGISVGRYDQRCFEVVPLLVSLKSPLANPC
jgi:hypothetical protein